MLRREQVAAEFAQGQPVGGVAPADDRPDGGDEGAHEATVDPLVEQEGQREQEGDQALAQRGGDLRRCLRAGGEYGIIHYKDLLGTHRVGQADATKGGLHLPVPIIPKFGMTHVPFINRKIRQVHACPNAVCEFLTYLRHNVRNITGGLLVTREACEAWTLLGYRVGSAAPSQ